MRVQYTTQSKTAAKDLAIFGIANFDYKFLANFKAWLAGALEAKGISSLIVKLDEFRSISLDQQSKIWADIKADCLDINRLLIIVPEFKGKLPIDLEVLGKIFPLSSRQIECKMITVDMSNPCVDHIGPFLDQFNHAQDFNDLSKPFQLLQQTRYQIKYNPNEDMCRVFQDQAIDLHNMTQHILSWVRTS